MGRPIKTCKCKHPNFKVRYFCMDCNLPLNTGIFSHRFHDECSGSYGVTELDGQHKIWRCQHYVYCPLCGWRCKDIPDLKRHLEIWDSETNGYVCEGWWRFGHEGVAQVKNEIKYWELKQEYAKLDSSAVKEQSSAPQEDSNG